MSKDTYAVVESGGKQHPVRVDSRIRVEKIDASPGDKVVLDRVLLVADGAATKIGTPLVAGASVTAEILEQRRAPKIIIFKKKRRSTYRRKNGHRQHVSVLRITGISA